MKKISVSILAISLSVLSYAQSDTLDLGYDMRVAKSDASVSADAVTQEQLLVSDSDVNSSLYGLLPGYNAGSNLIRGIGSFGGSSMLTIVDGAERALGNLDVEEIESVTILRDAAATAIYGQRGADGVIVVTTKRGGDEALKVKANYTFGVFTPFRVPEMADAYTYASVLNSTLANDGLKPQFSEQNMADIQSGNTAVIPNVNWRREVLKDIGHTNDFNVILSGSQKRMHVFALLNFNNNRGIYNNTSLNEGYSTQYSQSNLKARVNIDADLTRTTKVSFSLMANLYQSEQPAAGNDLSAVFNTPPVAFPIYNEGLFVKSAKFSNPLEEKVNRGYLISINRTLFADFAINQDLKGILPGLRVTGRVAYDNSADMYDQHNVSTPFYIAAYHKTDDSIDGFTFTKDGSSNSGFNSGLSAQYMNVTVYGKIDYARNFGKHGVNAAAIFSMNRIKRIGQNNVNLYQDNIVTASYNYDHRYYVSATVDFAGGAKFSAGHKYRVLPAVSAAAVLSREPFIKLRASWGLSDSDRRLSYDMDTQNNGYGKDYVFTGTSSSQSLAEGAIASPFIQPEQDSKSNIGIEGAFLDRRLDVQIEGFYNRRTRIRESGSSAYSSVLGIGVGDIFTGVVDNYGAELSLGWHERRGDFNYHVNGTLSYAHNTIAAMSEPYQPYEWLYRNGSTVNAVCGYTFDGFYSADDFDDKGVLKEGVVKSSYAAKLRPGDVKYKDLNSDGVIDGNDQKYLDCTTLPDWIYGIRLGMEYKGFGFEAMFDGTAGAKLWTTLSSVYRPLYNNDKTVSTWYLDHMWTPENGNARYPRLTTLSDNSNHNFLSSSVWLEDADYLKLRTLYVYYKFDFDWMKKIRMSEFRIFLRGNNLCSIDKVKIFDPQNVSFYYPSMRTFQIGIKCAF